MSDLDKFIDACREALNEPDPTAVIARSFDALLLEPESLEGQIVAKGNRVASNAIVVHHSPELTILDIRQKAGFRGSAHNHLMWIVQGVYRGREDNELYRLEQEQLTPAGDDLILEAPSVAVFPADIWHAPSNPLAVECATLQVCGGDFLAATPRRSAWDWQSGRAIPFTEAVLRARNEEASSAA